MKGVYHFLEIDIAVGEAEGNTDWIDWDELEGMAELLDHLEKRAAFADFLRARGDELPI